MQDLPAVFVLIAKVAGAAAAGAVEHREDFFGGHALGALDEGVGYLRTAVGEALEWVLRGEFGELLLGELVELRLRDHGRKQKRAERGAEESAVGHSLNSTGGHWCDRRSTGAPERRLLPGLALPHNIASLECRSGAGERPCASGGWRRNRIWHRRPASPRFRCGSSRACRCLRLQPGLRCCHRIRRAACRGLPSGRSPSRPWPPNPYLPGSCPPRSRRVRRPASLRGSTGLRRRSSF